MRKNFCKLLGMKVPLYFELWIEEACANIPVSSLHLQAHPVALCVWNCPWQAQGSEEGMDPSSGTLDPVWLCDRAQAVAASTQGGFQCWHHVLSPLQWESATAGQLCGMRGRWQTPLPSTIWYLCMVLLLLRAHLHVPLKKGGHPSPAIPVPDPCPPVTRRDPERAFALHALHNPHWRVIKRP